VKHDSYQNQLLSITHQALVFEFLYFRALDSIYHMINIITNYEPSTSTLVLLNLLHIKIKQ